MATTTKTFSFAADEEAWVPTDGPATTASWQSGDGSPASGCIQFRIAGKNKSDTPYYEWTGTWEDLGVTAGDTVSEVGTSPDNDYNWKCSEYNVGAASETGAFEIRDSGGTLIGTFSAALGFSSTTAWATRNGSAVTISPASASTTTIKLRLNASLNTGNNNSAAVTLRWDEVKITITHSTPSATRRVFVT